MATTETTEMTTEQAEAAAADAILEAAAKRPKAKPAGAHGDAPAPRKRTTRAQKDAAIAKAAKLGPEAAVAESRRQYPKGPPKPAATRVTGRDAVRKVLADGKPRRPGEIATEAVKLIRPKPAGKTPEATIGALLYVQAKKDDGFVIRTGTGNDTTFQLRA